MQLGRDGQGSVEAGVAASEPPTSSRLVRSLGWLEGFSELADPERYTARPETERVLRELLQCVAKPGVTAAVASPPGFGKSLLLRVVARRLAGKLHCVVLPYAALAAEDLASWALGLLAYDASLSERLDRVAAGPASSRLLALAEALRSERTGIVLLIDDAGGMPIETARALRRWAEGSRGALRLVVATCDDSRGGRVIAAIGGAVKPVRLATPMTLRETAEYVEARLARGAAPEPVRRRASAELLGRIHRLSGGVPRLVERMAAWELSDLPPGVHVPWGEDGLLDLADSAPVADLEDLDDLGEELSPELPAVLIEDAPRSR